MSTTLVGAFGVGPARVLVDGGQPSLGHETTPGFTRQKVDDGHHRAMVPTLCHQFASVGIWRALTDPNLLTSWLMPNDFRAVVGHRSTFRTDPVPAQGLDGIVHCEVLTLEPPRLLRISWVADGIDMTVTWQLIAEGTGTRVLLTHHGFDGDDPGQQATSRPLGGGWRGHLVRRLEETLATPA